MSPEALGTKRKVVLDQTRCSRANGVVKIPIRVCFFGILTKVNYWLVLKAKCKTRYKLTPKALIFNPSMLLA